MNKKKIHKQLIKKKQIFKKMKDTDLKFVSMLKMQNINKIKLTSLGNSIAFGFSLSHKIKPLLKRNIFLESILKQNSIRYDVYNFARPQDNNDEHFLDWIINNRKLSYINNLISIDLGNTDKSMKNVIINESDLKSYYPLYPKNDIGLQDIIRIKEKKLANIIIYNGLTGSFLDNITRDGCKNAIKRFL